MVFLDMLDKLKRAIYAILFALVAIMIVVGFLQVVFRYVLEASLSWSEELMRYINVWTIFLGLSVGIPAGLHVAIDAIYHIIDERKGRFLATVVHILTLVFLLLITVIGFKFTMLNLEQSSPAMDVPMSIVVACIPIGGLSGLLFTIGEMIKARRKEAETACR